MESETGIEASTLKVLNMLARHRHVHTLPNHILMHAMPYHWYTPDAAISALPNRTHFLA